MPNLGWYTMQRSGSSGQAHTLVIDGMDCFSFLEPKSTGWAMLLDSMGIIQ